MWHLVGMSQRALPSLPVDLEAARAYLAESDEELLVYIDDTHLSYLPLYLSRAHAMQALGEPPDTVLRQLWLAGRCYGDHGGVYLAKWPRHQLRRRRLLPLELALIVADLPLIEKISTGFGLDAMVLLARAEPDTVTHEVRVMSSFFHGGSIENRGDVAGTLAVLYWLALSAIAEERVEPFEAVRALAARIIERHARDIEARVGGLGRILYVHDALAAMRPAAPELVVDALAGHYVLHLEDLAAKAADEPEILSRGEGLVDTTSLALLAVATAVGVDLGEALRARREDPALAVALAYAEALGHTASQ